MHFIERDAQGQIVRIEASAFPQATEQRTQTTPEIEEWLKKRGAAGSDTATASAQ